MLSDYKDVKTIFILFFAGVSCGLSLSFIYLIPLLILGYFYFIKILLITKGNDVTFFNGCTFGFGFFLGCLHWIVYPFLVYDKHLILAPFVLILFPLFLSSFFGFAALGINIFNKSIKKDFLFCRISIFSITLFFFEFLRSFIFGGLPLSLTAHIWAFSPNFISVVSYVGVFGLCFFTIFWIVSSSILFLNKKLKLSFLILLIFPTALYFIPLSHAKDSDKKILVRVIQPNINQKEKWNKNLYQRHFQTLIDLTNKNLSEEPILVVWPEVALTLFLNEEKELINYLRDVIPSNVFLIIGSLRREFNGSSFKIFNSLYTLNNNKLDYYDKVKLVPFGEFIPFKSFLSILKLTPGTTDFSVGNKEDILGLTVLDKTLYFEPSICYESIFQSFHYKSIGLHVNITNDAWFGNTTGPKQHLSSSIFRSVEKGVPLVRSANSGISVILDKTGKILEKKNLNEKGFIETEIILGNNSTVFMKFGNKLLAILIITLTCLSFLLDYSIKITKKD